MRVSIQHRSRYHYPRPALLGPQLIRLRPAEHARARIESYSLVVAPEHRLHWQRDPHGNHIARVTFKAGQPVTELDILVELAVDVQPINPFDFFVDDRVKRVPFVYPDRLDTELAPYLDTGDPAYRLGRAGTELLCDLPAKGDTIGVLIEMLGKVRERIAYVIRNEPGVWTPEETIGHGRGSCRDTAVLLVALLRARGIAARFVSGYLVQLADEGMIPDEPKGVTADVVDLHAWAEVYIPGGGWIGLDGTSGLLCGEGHIPLAATASPSHASPLDGTSDVAASGVDFSTSIHRLGHEARPTAPYPDEVWSALTTAGDRTDAALVAAQLEVWIGGEPTFVAREGQTKEEWQGEAIGADKWRRGRTLADQLRDRLVPGGIVLYRQGKHYPGESLPRWALDVIGRRDGSVLWPDRELADAGTLEAAHRVGTELAAALGIPSTMSPAYEDPWEVLRVEATLPPSIDPRTAGLDDPEERRRLAKALDHGVGREVGYVLPLARGSQAWATEQWQFRREHLFLIPGDSAIGLRLPLGSLASAAPVLWADAPDLPDPRRDDAESTQAAEAVKAAAAAAERRDDLLKGGLRTAVSIEPRDGQLWVFLPPVPRFADFCELVRALDRVRETTKHELHLEGYSPPPSPAMKRFSVTPDPGVLEVNLPPAASSREITELHHVVFDAALTSGLTAERYLLDGRASGSGGGNHITVGGPHAEQSPWLVRPSLLASLIAFVQHHPSLSYLFSGMFVGPTSQAPRIDEARHDALYELELALPRVHENPPAWQVDALLRHLLVDVGGSTHRAELSIDKLFDPHTPFGRQGLVEFRAFEMPPHPRMAAAQAILIRTLLAAFVKQPYNHALVRWGGSLHDRFLLPYWIWRDFEDVLAHLATAELALPADAFKPFVELRCPLVGTLDAPGGGHVEVRNAIEPWHVLGEEASQTGTSRYVDSSMERLELRTLGLDPERFAVTVNNVLMPMREGAGRDIRVGGVRFRAWCPPHALHPHMGIHHPLRIDLVDTWARRGVVGGTYHVWHPEGRSYDAAPLTRVEAAARRAQRFTVSGPMQWPIHARAVAPHPEQPYTLDLRRVDLGAPMPRAEDWVTV